MADAKWCIMLIFAGPIEDRRSARLSPHRLYFKLSYKGVGEQTSNGQNKAFTFSMIQYPFVSFLKVILGNMIRLHHFLSV